MAGEKVGEAYVDIRYRLNELAKDLKVAQAAIDNQVAKINRDVQTKTDGMFVGVEKQLQKLVGGFDLLKGALLVTLGQQALSAINAFKDKIAETGAAMQQMQARLDQTLGVGAFDDTVEMANRLGVAIKDASDATARFGLAAKDIGLTRDQTLQLTETVVKLGRIGNASASEMSAGMMQLAQALASGRFQGDELRSVMEQLPEVARAIAKELGVSIGELRKMGSEGKLTADVVAGALLKAADDASERFAKLPESLEQSQARWQNASDQLFAALDKALGASEFVKWWNNFRSQVAEGITVDLGGGSSDTQIKVLTERLEALKQGNWIGENNRLIAEVQQQLDAAKRDKAMAGREAGGMPELAATPTGPSPQSIYPTPTLEDAQALKGYLDDARQAREQAAEDQKRLNREAEAEAERAKDAQARLEEARMMDLRRSIEETVEEEDNRLKAVKEANEKIARENQEARQQEMEAKEAQRRMEIEADPAAYYFKTGDKELAPIYDASTGARDALKDLADQSVQYGRMMGDAIRQGADTAAQALTEMALTGKLNVQSLLKDLAELALNQVFRMAINGALGAMGNAMFGPSAAAAPTGAGGGPRGYAMGGVFDHGHVTPLARGGIVSAATIVPLARGAALMGEAGPEAVMPLARDGKGRLGVRNGAGGGGSNVTIVDQRGAGAPPIEQQKRSNADGGIDIQLIIRSEVNKALGSGNADDAMAQRFGLKPKVTR